MPGAPFAPRRLPAFEIEQVEGRRERVVCELPADVGLPAIRAGWPRLAHSEKTTEPKMPGEDSQLEVRHDKGARRVSKDWRESRL